MELPAESPAESPAEPAAEAPGGLDPSKFSAYDLESLRIRVQNLHSSCIYTAGPAEGCR